MSYNNTLPIPIVILYLFFFIVLIFSQIKMSKFLTKLRILSGVSKIEYIKYALLDILRIGAIIVIGVLIYATM
jgi:hypothetical protein